MCLQYNVNITETLADQLTSSGENNSRLLIQLAEAAQRQGDYQLAAKKFTQAGDKAMRLIEKKLAFIYSLLTIVYIVFAETSDEGFVEVW